MSVSPSAGAPGAAVLTPSELVYLFGTQFAARGGAPLGEPHLPDNREVRIDQLGIKLLSVALLANEQAGSLRLEARTKKILFGLRSTTSLYAVATDKVPPFPEGTWEVRLFQPLLDARERTLEVNQLADRNLVESESPWGEVIGILLGAMQFRGLLEIVDTKVLKVFHSKRFRLPERTATLAAAQSLAPVRQLLADCEQSRPEIWKLLTAQLSSGVRRNQQSTDNDVDISSN